MKITEKAYAKINLFLKVVGETKDGYHSLETLMAPIDLYDELSFEDAPSIIVEGIEIQNNSIQKAAEALTMVCDFDGVKISVKKQIPIEAGLAGGSTDSSATLRGINRFCRLGLDYPELQMLSDKLGSDNTFCLYNEAAICTNRGEQLNFIKKVFSLNVLLIKPNYGCSTKKIFELYKDNDKEYPSNDEILSAIYNQDYSKINQLIYNDLYEPACQAEPRLNELSNKIRNYGFTPHMTGSGSTLFVLDASIDKLNGLKKKFDDCFTCVTIIKNSF